VAGCCEHEKEESDSIKGDGTGTISCSLNVNKLLKESALSLAPQPSLGLGFLRNLLPLKVAEFLGGFSTIFFFTG
jgi:hypothetical protein